MKLISEHIEDVEYINEEKENGGKKRFEEVWQRDHTQ